MKISRKSILILGGIFSAASLGLMFTSASVERELSQDLNNAIQHIVIVKIIPVDGTNIEVTGEYVGDRLIRMRMEKGNFVLSQTGSKSNSIIGGKYSTILGGSGNKIGGSGNKIGGSWDVILGGSGNQVKGTNNSILGGEGNSVVGDGEGSYNVVVGGKNNKIEGNKSVTHSVIVGGSDNLIISGQYSVVMGKNSSVLGDQSVALGSGSKIDANNSFLWTDGTQSNVLAKDDVFTVISKSGTVINTNKAHSFAKLTLGGPIILFADGTGEIMCGGGTGGGIVKVAKSDNDQMCVCSCNGLGWNSLLGDGRCLSVCNDTIKPECGEDVTVVAGGDSQYLVYSGSCKKGKVVGGTGAYFVTKDNIVYWSCQEKDGSVVGCSGNVTTRSSEYKQTCGGTPPTGDGVILGSGNYLSTTGRNWTSIGNGTPGACQWTCVSGYHVDGNECVGNTKQGNCTGGTIEHGRYIVEQVDVTWNTSTNMWNTVPCTHFTCNTGYQENSAGTGCEAIQYQCTGVSVGTNLEHTVFVTGTDLGLTVNTKKELYATYAEARDNKKCAYVCDAAHGWVYDNTDGKACRAVTTICGDGANKCLNPAIATNMGGDASKYTWDCEVEGTVVKAGCFMCKDEYVKTETGCVEKKDPVNLTCSDIPYMCDGSDGNQYTGTRAIYIEPGSQEEAGYVSEVSGYTESFVFAGMMKMMSGYNWECDGINGGGGEFCSSCGDDNLYENLGGSPTLCMYKSCDYQCRNTVSSYSTLNKPDKEVCKINSDGSGALYCGRTEYGEYLVHQSTPNPYFVDCEWLPMYGSKTIILKLDQDESTYDSYWCPDWEHDKNGDWNAEYVYMRIYNKYDRFAFDCDKSVYGWTYLTQPVLGWPLVWECPNSGDGGSWISG